EAGIDVVRVPGGDRPSPRAALVRAGRSRLSADVSASGLRHPAAVVGLTGAGSMTGEVLTRSLDHIVRRHRGRTVELVLHPGRPDDPDRSRYAWGYRWGDEWRSTTDGSLVDACGRRKIRLVGPGDLEAP
ncbi:MAG: hypothetical protein AAGK32_06655, partial [Actinomycetota bacterium]